MVLVFSRHQKMRACERYLEVDRSIENYFRFILKTTSTNCVYLFCALRLPISFSLARTRVLSVFARNNIKYTMEQSKNIYVRCISVRLWDTRASKSVSSSRNILSKWQASEKDTGNKYTQQFCDDSKNSGLPIKIFVFFSNMNTTQTTKKKGKETKIHGRRSHWIVLFWIWLLLFWLFVSQHRYDVSNISRRAKINVIDTLHATMTSNGFQTIKGIQPKQWNTQTHQSSSMCDAHLIHMCVRNEVTVKWIGQVSEWFFSIIMVYRSDMVSDSAASLNKKERQQIPEKEYEWRHLGRCSSLIYINSINYSLKKKKNCWWETARSSIDHFLRNLWIIHFQQIVVIFV